MPYEQHASRVRKLAQTKGVRIKFGDHALVEMGKDSINAISVLSMLKRCSSSGFDLINFQERIRATGRDNNDNKITAVVVIDEDSITIFVVTAWR